MFQPKVVAGVQHGLKFSKKDEKKPFVLLFGIAVVTCSLTHMGPFKK